MIYLEFYNLKDNKNIRNNLLKLYRKLDTFPEVMEVLKYLKSRGCSSAILSNGTIEMLNDAVTSSKIGDYLEVILSAIEDVLMKNPPTGRTDLSGKKVLVTAGPTREYLDPVRFITNRSSGKMGYAIAEVAHQRGAEVTLISGPVSIEAPTGISPIFTQTTNELYQAVMSKMDSVDVIIMAAAVADYQAKTVSNQKIKKSSSVNELTLLLQPTIDIAADLGKKKKKEQILITFAAETENLTENAKLKLKSKNCDLVVANDITDPEAGFDIETNVVTLIDKENSYQLPVMSKKEVAENIFDQYSGVSNLI